MREEMKFYLKYILLGIVIGLIVLGLLYLAGFEDSTPSDIAKEPNGYTWDRAFPTITAALEASDITNGEVIYVDCYVDCEAKE